MLGAYIQKFSWRISFCFLSLVVVSHDAVAQLPIVIQKSGTAVLFQAPTTADTRDRVLALLDDSVKTFVVNSGGGDALPAIDLGREIRRRNLKLVVLGVCASSCAHFMFVAAKQRVVQPESLVVFHNTNSSMLKMIGANQIPAVTREHFLASAKAEKAFYDEIGIPDTLLLEPQAEMLTVCFTYKDPPAGNEQDIQYGSRFQGWTPTKEYLEAAGVHVEGFWPSIATMDDAIKAYHKLFTPAFKWRSLGPDKPAAHEALEGAYKQFGHVCSDAELKAP